MKKLALRQKQMILTLLVKIHNKYVQIITVHEQHIVYWLTGLKSFNFILQFFIESAPGWHHSIFSISSGRSLELFCHSSSDQT